MPNVKGKKFPYTAARKKAAAAYAAKPAVKKKPMKKPLPSSNMMTMAIISISGEQVSISILTLIVN